VLLTAVVKLWPDGSDAPVAAVATGGHNSVSAAEKEFFAHCATSRPRFRLRKK